MGQVVNGVWTEEDALTRVRDGRFMRAESYFRDVIGADGLAAEPGRYHLYVARSCPWAHRTIIFRHLKGLEDVIPMTLVARRPDGPTGWAFIDGAARVPGTDAGADYLHEFYTSAKPDYSGRVTVPTLWDAERRTIVSNESSEIIRMFNAAFDAFGNGRQDLYPADLRDDIDAVNTLVYENINNGVYRAGFATEQGAYEKAYDDVFAALDTLDARLGGQRYLCGDRVTEADWRLYPTLLRFDIVYFSHFKCNRQRIADFANLPNYLRELYQVPGVAATAELGAIKHGYYSGQTKVNPRRIVPKGPIVDLDAPHDRERFPAAPGGAANPWA